MTEPRCQVPSCPDFGEPDFGEATCPSWHADEPSPPVEAAGPSGPVGRSVGEIRADLARCDRDGVPWPEAARRLLADVPGLLAEVEAAHRVELAAGVEREALLAEVERLRAGPLTFAELSAKSQSRRDRWHTPDTEPWTGADWSNAMCGEAGEAANVVKKIRRHETGMVDKIPMDELVPMLADELGDVVAYCDLLARHYGIDLGAAVARKFNVISEREGFPERLGAES